MKTQKGLVDDLTALGRSAEDIVHSIRSLDIKGVVRCSSSCPIANYLKGKGWDNPMATQSYVAASNEGEQFYFQLTMPLHNFIVMFDREDYPDLIEDA
jgi:hypothetical protein